MFILILVLVSGLKMFEVMLGWFLMVNSVILVFLCEKVMFEMIFDFMILFLLQIRVLEFLFVFLNEDRMCSLILQCIVSLIEWVCSIFVLRLVSFSIFLKVMCFSLCVFEVMCGLVVQMLFILVQMLQCFVVKVVVKVMVVVFDFFWFSVVMWFLGDMF